MYNLLHNEKSHKKKEIFLKKNMLKTNLYIRIELHR
jgi:hypothetical protein